VSQLRSTPSDVAAALAGAVTGMVAPKVHLEADPDLILTDPDQAHALVRCVQEIVTNTVRHSGAENLWITVGRDATGVTVHSRDDGRGTATIRPGNGLTGMRERLEQVGGRLSYQSAPGRGFHLEASLPTP
jgi:signal transduction histidine kinase